MRNYFAEIVERELRRLGWLCENNATATLAVVTAPDDLPYGWVRIRDDHDLWGCGDACKIVSQLSGITRETCDYAECLQELNLVNAPLAYAYWPERLKSVTRIDSTSDWHLVTVATNAGLRFAGGPHNDQYDALWCAFNAGMLRSTVEEVAKDWEEESSRSV